MKPHTFRYFFIPYLLFLALGLLQIATLDYGDAVIWMNANQNDLLSGFFKIWTYAGDWMIFAVIALTLLLVKRKAGYVFLLVGLIDGVISWSLKNVFFQGTPRPKKYFENEDLLEFVAGVEIQEVNSFPSGHTMTAFAMAAFLALILKKKEWSIILLFGAVLVGLSRIYLSQHFLVDVVVGSMIGVAISLSCFLIFQRFLFKE